MNTLPRVTLAVLLVVAARFAPQCDAGESISPSASAKGSIRTAYWTRSRSLDRRSDIATASVWLNGKLDLDAAGTVKLDAWAGAQSRDNRQGDRNHRLRELYWQQYLGDADIRIGRQMIIWGRADGINPTDNVTPHDFTLLTPEDSDQRFGVLAANILYPIGNQSLQFIWQPRVESDTIPLPDLPQVTYQKLSPQRRGQVAVKLDHTGTDVDWSLSFLDGDNLVPDFSLVAVRPDGITIGLDNHRQQVWGADAATTVGPYVFRGEIARTVVRWDHSGNSDAAFFHKHPQTQLVMGGERTIGEHLTVNVQYFAQRVLGYRNPERLTDLLLREIAQQQAAASNQTEGFQQGMTFRLAWNWANYTWQAETSGIYILTNHARYWHGKLQHALNDRWRLEMGFDRYSGPTYSITGRLKDNSTLFAELRYGF